MAETGAMGLAFTGPLPRHQVVARPEAGSLWRSLVLLATLPFFFQFFHYMIDLPPAYVLSKAWPLLTMPLALWAVLTLRLPHTALYLCMLAYVLGLTPLMGALHLGSSPLEAAAAAVRPLAIIHGLSLAGMLWLLRPDLVDIRRAFLTLGFATFAAFWLLWLVMPTTAYRADPNESQVFFRDIERGFRIVLMMGFAAVTLFWMARRAVEQRSILYAGGTLAGLATMLMVYKQRMVIASVLAVLGLMLLRKLPPALRVLGFLMGGGVGLAGLFYWTQLASDTASNLLGGSLSIRLQSSRLAWNFISDDPWRWLFGVGSTTSQSAVTLAEILNYRSFYVTDIGWLGVVMEFGLVGALLILAALTWAIITAGRLAAQARDAFTGALADWSVMLLVVTAVYSPVYAPGEVASLTALVWYLSQRGQGQFKA